MRHFKNGLSQEELTIEYRNLAKKYHPDICHLPNATEIMQEINAEYDNYFVSIRKQEIGVDWSDIFSRYAEARRSRETILMFLRFDKQEGAGWFGIVEEAGLFRTYKNKYVSDDDHAWENFHGGFALVSMPRVLWNGRTVKRIPAKIECPSVQDMYFAMIGQPNNSNSTYIQSAENMGSAAYVSEYGNYQHIRTKNGREMWVEGDKAYMKVNDLVMSTTIPRSVLIDSKVIGEYSGSDLGFWQYQNCSEEEFVRTHDVGYVPQYCETLGCKRLMDKDFWWIDDPVVAHFARIGVLRFFEAGTNFRKRFGTFVLSELKEHLHEISYDDAEHIQDYLDELNGEFEDYVKSMVKRGRIRIA